MKLTATKSHFKSVSKGQAERNPSLGDKIGKKRADLEWSFYGFESLDEVTNKEHALFFINKAIEDYGRELIANNGNNWDFKPSVESLTLTDAYNYANSEVNRARTLTKITASKFADFYAKHAPALIEIKAEAALAAKVVLVDWITYTKKDNFRVAMHARLVAFATAIMSLPDNNQVMADFAEDEADLPAVLDALIKAFAEPDKQVITADAL